MRSRRRGLRLQPARLASLASGAGEALGLLRDRS